MVKYGIFKKKQVSSMIRSHLGLTFKSMTGTIFDGTESLYLYTLDKYIIHEIKLGTLTNNNVNV